MNNPLIIFIIFLALWFVLCYTMLVQMTFIQCLKDSTSTFIRWLTKYTIYFYKDVYCIYY